MEGYNISIIGKSGVGKSSLLNYLFGENLATVGSGKPQTKKGFLLKEGAIEGNKVNIYDSWGLEAGKDKLWLEDFIHFQKEKQNEKNVAHWLHTVVYCLAGDGKRIEDFEIRIIQEIQKEALKPVIVISKGDSRGAEEFAIKIEKILGIKPIMVNSIRKEKGFSSKKIFEAFGKENLIKAIKNSATVSLDSRIRFLFDAQLETKVDEVKQELLIVLEEELETRSTMGYVSDNSLKEIRNRLDQILVKRSKELEEKMQKFITDAQNFYESHVFQTLNYGLKSKMNSNFDEQFEADLNLKIVMENLSAGLAFASILPLITASVFALPVAVGVFFLAKFTDFVEPETFAGIPKYSKNKILKKFREQLQTKERSVAELTS